MTTRIAISTRKGGVGKSEVLVALASAFARKKERVLAVDLDPQANASRRLGAAWEADAGKPSISEVIKADAVGVGEDAVVSCGWTDENGNPTEEASYIDVLAARLDLINREGEAGQVGALRRLKKALDGGWTDKYDWILFDNKPDLGHLVQLSLAATDYVLVPSTLDFDAVAGAIEVRQFIAEHADDMMNPSLKLLAVLPTRYDKRKAEQNFQYDNLREYFPDELLKFARNVERNGTVEFVTPSYIPERTRFAEADSAAVSLTAWNDATARETVAIYDALADALTTRVSELAAEVAA
ncbi:ParA family protein [Leifsonia sp. McL0607]|uniref:ParA family protein n=1 Tax=Leifsonia sp. McL0607 TaxID=3415672 RepID=UPI003CE6EBF9